MRTRLLLIIALLYLAQLAQAQSFTGFNLVESEPSAAEFTVYDSGFDVVADTPIYINTRDSRQLSTNWYVCTGMAKVVHKHFIGKKSRPENVSLREYSRMSDDGDFCSASPQPCRLWKEIVDAQEGDIFPNLFRNMSFSSSKNTFKQYEKIKEAIANKRTAIVYVDCTQKDAVLHALVAYKIEETEDTAKIWVYDCNLIYFPTNIPSSWSEAKRRAMLTPIGHQHDTQTELNECLTTTEKGRQFLTHLKIGATNKTYLEFDRQSGQFSFSEEYNSIDGGDFVLGYVRTMEEAKNLRILVRD